MQSTYGGGEYDAFVTQLVTANGGCCALGYSTYLGGSAWEAGWAVSVDREGNPYVAGFTESSNFPITRGAFQSQVRGARTRDAFVTEIISATGVYTYGYSTYLGGSDDDQASAIALDANGTPYVAGFTSSRDFPTSPNAVQPAYAGDPKDAFVVRLGPFNLQLKESPFPTSTPR